MDREGIDNSFEDFLRGRTDQFRMYPSESIWTELSARIHRPQRWPLILGGVLLFGIGIGAGMMLERLSSAHTDRGAITITSEKLRHDQPAASLPPDQSVVFADPVNEQTRIVKSFLLSGQFQPVVMSHSANQNVPKNAPGFAMADPFVRTINAVPDGLATTIADIDEDVSMINAGRLRPMAMARKTPSQVKTDKERALKPSAITSVTANVLNTIGRIGKKTGLQLYVAPSFSYRRLVGQASKTSYPYSGFAYSANYGFPTDVNDAVVHKPAFGLEIGSALTQNIGRKLRLKVGLQFNFNNYDIEAYSYMPELAPMSAARISGLGSSINAVSYYRNSNGFDRTWLRNSHLMVSLPVGFEASLFGNRRVRFNVASTIQPTYVLNNKSYMISTNLKNYAQEPELYRNWNLNAGAEAYISVDAGTYRWVMGPQMRYQLLSSYKEDYPIREHLVDYGFKIGIQKTLK